MMVRFIARAAIAAALMVVGSGCVVVRSTYQSCDPSVDSCAGVSTCVQANLTSNPSGAPATFCSTGCNFSSDCPADPSGNPVSCAITAGSSGVCYRECSPGGACPAGQTCSTVSGLLLCVPGSGGTPVVCGGSGQTCCAGSTPCSAGLACGSTGVCGVACGASGETCCAGGACGGGLSCGSNGICAPACGNTGDPCCQGSAPCASGLTCGSNGTCGLAPYAGCSASSIGAACFAGVNAAGQTVATTCEQPTIANPGPTGFCTSQCVSSASECPQDVAGAPVGCIQLQGTSGSLCFVQCTTDAGCPPATVCRQVPAENGTLVQVCLPPTT